jgi:hypothetical protein
MSCGHHLHPNHRRVPVLHCVDFFCLCGCAVFVGEEARRMKRGAMADDVVPDLPKFWHGVR